jgi:hypothetical protein
MASKTGGGVGSNQHAIRGVSQAQAAAGLPEDGLELGGDPVDLSGVREPDFDDFTQAADDAVRMSGLERSWERGETFWDDSRWAPDNLGLNLRVTGGDVEVDYLSEEVAGEYRSLPQSAHDRELQFATFGRGSLTDESAAYVSVSLNEDERTAVADRLRAGGEDFAEDMVAYWASADPRGLQDCFGFTSPHRQWEATSQVVRGTLADAGAAVRAFVQRTIRLGTARVAIAVIVGIQLSVILTVICTLPLPDSGLAFGASMACLIAVVTITAIRTARPATQS